MASFLVIRLDVAWFSGLRSRSTCRYLYRSCKFRIIDYGSVVYGSVFNVPLMVQFLYNPQRLQCSHFRSRFMCRRWRRTLLSRISKAALLLHHSLKKLHGLKYPVRIFNDLLHSSFYHCKSRNLFIGQRVLLTACHTKRLEASSPKKKKKISLEIDSCQLSLSKVASSHSN